MKYLFSGWRRPAFTLLLSGLYSSIALAQESLPWDGPLTQLKDSLTGNVAKSIGVIALAVAGGTLAFGGELSDFTKRILMVVLALAVMLMAGGFITSLGLNK